MATMTKAEMRSYIIKRNGYVFPIEFTGARIAAHEVSEHNPRLKVVQWRKQMTLYVTDRKAFLLHLYEFEANMVAGGFAAAVDDTERNSVWFLNTPGEVELKLKEHTKLLPPEKVAEFVEKAKAAA